MKWNWQQKDWPTFRYDAQQIEAFEQQFLKDTGMLLGAFKHLDEESKSLLTIDIISNEALKTSEIEGEYLNRESVKSSIRQQFGLQTDHPKSTPAEQGIAEMMVNAYQLFSDPLSHEKLFSWNEMVTKGRYDLTDLGRYRTHSEPMQIVSGSLHDPKVHFEAPPSSMVKGEMDRFVDWFNETSPSGKVHLPALTRAGIAHLYFVTIHPFEDGNGRIGRVIAEKAINQAMGQPVLLALAYIIEKHKKAYYDALERVNYSNEITDWLIYFAKTVLEAQRYTQNYVEFLIKKTKLYDKVRGKLNERQEKALARMFREGAEGFKGGLSAEKYISITKTSRATATRDLQELVELGVFLRSGEKRHTRYYFPFSNS